MPARGFFFTLTPRPQPAEQFENAPPVASRDECAGTVPLKPPSVAPMRAPRVAALIGRCAAAPLLEL
jgi:energy-converting hydrogenase Eha subunit F